MNDSQQSTNVLLAAPAELYSLKINLGSRSVAHIFATDYCGSKILSLKTNRYMKKILLAGCCLLIGIQAISQTSFSPVVKKFIDYDTSGHRFTHCKLADVKHLKVLEDQTVIVRNGIITAIADSKKLSAPAGSTVIDLTGKSLLPGFVLLHEHMFYAAYSADFTYLHVKAIAVHLPQTIPGLRRNDDSYCRKR